MRPMARQTKNVMLGIRVPEALERRIRYIAEQNDQYVSEAVREVLEEAFGDVPMAPAKSTRKRSLI